jgi:hypothetical protein
MSKLSLSWKVVLILFCGVLITSCAKRAMTVSTYTFYDSNHKPYKKVISKPKVDYVPMYVSNEDYPISFKKDTTGRYAEDLASYPLRKESVVDMQNMAWRALGGAILLAFSILGGMFSAGSPLGDAEAKVALLAFALIVLAGVIIFITLMLIAFFQFLFLIKLKNELEIDDVFNPKFLANAIIGMVIFVGLIIYFTEIR